MGPSVYAVLTQILRLGWGGQKPPRVTLTGAQQATEGQPVSEGSVSAQGVGPVAAAMG